MLVVSSLALLAYSATPEKSHSSPQPSAAGDVVALVSGLAEGFDAATGVTYTDCAKSSYAYQLKSDVDSAMKYYQKYFNPKSLSSIMSMVSLVGTVLEDIAPVYTASACQADLAAAGYLKANLTAFAAQLAHGSVTAYAHLALTLKLDQNTIMNDWKKVVKYWARSEYQETGQKLGDIAGSISYTLLQYNKSKLKPALKAPAAELVEKPRVEVKSVSKSVPVDGVMFFEGFVLGVANASSIKNCVTSSNISEIANAVSTLLDYIQSSACETLNLKCFIQAATYLQAVTQDIQAVEMSSSCQTEMKAVVALMTKLEAIAYDVVTGDSSMVAKLETALLKNEKTLETDVASFKQAWASGDYKTAGDKVGDIVGKVTASV
jgi:hypothetical protein